MVPWLTKLIYRQQRDSWFFDDDNNNLNNNDTADTRLDALINISSSWNQPTWGFVSTSPRATDPALLGRGRLLNNYEIPL
jgi:hypothetical protein